MVVDPDVQAASGGQGKRILGGKESATERTVGECHLVCVHAPKQNLGKGSHHVVLPERKARAEEISQGSNVCIVHVGRSRIPSRKSHLRVGVGAKVADQSQVTIHIESERRAAAIHTRRFPAAIVGTARR